MAKSKYSWKDSALRDSNGAKLDSGYVATPMGCFSLFEKGITVTKKNAKNQETSETYNYPNQEQFAQLYEKYPAFKKRIDCVEETKKNEKAE